MTITDALETTSVRDLTEIVIPVDFSALGWQVLPLAETLAGATDAEIRFLHVDMSSPWRDEDPNALTVTATPYAKHVQVDVVASSDPARGILTHLTAHPHALVAMATHARHPLESAARGGVLTDVLRGLARSMLAVGPKFDVRSGSGVRRVAVCVSGDEDASLILPDALAWARALDVPVEVVNVSPNEPAWRTADDVVERTVQAAKAGHQPVTGITLVGAHPGQEIVRYAASVPGTLLALATHGRSGLPAALVGSVAAQVVRESASGMLLRRFPNA